MKKRQKIDNIMKYDYRNKQEWDEWLRAQTVKAIGQAVAVAIGILLCALIAALTGCKSHKSMVTEQTTATMATASASLRTDTTATERDSTHTTQTWHSVQRDTTAAQTWHTIEFAPTGGTITIDQAGTLHATNVTAYLAHATATHTISTTTNKAADSTAVSAHSTAVHTSRDTAYSEANTVTTTTTTASTTALTWWQRTLMRIGQLALAALLITAAYIWLKRRKQ